MKNYQIDNTLEHIKILEGKKATIYKMSDMGFPNIIQCEIKKVELKNYAQYTNLLHIVYRPKRKRTDYVIRLHDYSDFAIWSGHIDVKSDMFVSSKTNESGITIRESLLSFSNEYLQRALQSTNIKPIFLQSK